MKKKGMGRQTQKAGYTLYSGFTKLGQSDDYAMKLLVRPFA